MKGKQREKKISTKKEKENSLFFILNTNYRNILKSVENSLDFEKGIAILDLGCGPGSWILVNISSKFLCNFVNVCKYR